MALGHSWGSESLVEHCGSADWTESMAHKSQLSVLET